MSEMEKKVLFLQSYFKRIIFSLLIIILLTVSLLPQTQKLSYNYIDDALHRAVVSFALAKGLNALISVAQGTEIAATPAGVGVNFAIGELLDPINDMVERFSWVMLASSVSLGIQKILSFILGSLALKIILSLLAVTLLYAFLTHKEKLTPFALKFFIFFMILRLSMPLIALANQALYTAYLSPSYIQSTQALQNTTSEIQALQEEDKSQNTSVWAKIKEVYKSTAEGLNIKKQINTLTAKLNDTFNHVLTLITIFIVETIIFPLLFLYLFIKLVKFSGLSSRLSDILLMRFKDKIIVPQNQSLS